MLEKAISKVSIENEQKPKFRTQQTATGGSDAWQTSACVWQWTTRYLSGASGGVCFRTVTRKYSLQPTPPTAATARLVYEGHTKVDSSPGHSTCDGDVQITRIIQYL